MADKPIPFSAPMVRALLDGRKTQTRRIAKFVETNPGGLFHVHNAGGGSISCDAETVAAIGPDYAPYAVGDRLWVREAWQGEAGDLPPIYAATCERTEAGWRPAIHMPRWASRLTLVVTEVRVQRLQEISEEDAEAEGVETDAWDMALVARRYGYPDGWFVGWSIGIEHPSVSVECDEVCRRSYASLWDVINGAGAWDANPWVAAYTFTVHPINIDVTGDP